MKELVLPKQFASGDNADGYTGLSKKGLVVLTDDLLEKYEAVDFDIKAGDGIIFFNKTLHASKKTL